DSPYVEMHDEEYDDGDARTMSPRRGSEETEKMGEEARQALVRQTKAIKETLLKVGDCVESLKSEHEKFEDGNRFLQAYVPYLDTHANFSLLATLNRYVGELIQTRKSPPGRRERPSEDRTSE
ncbi:hypothetical protein DM02DRAFT_545829, partial [Periconia macrospinosa]